MTRHVGLRTRRRAPRGTRATTLQRSAACASSWARTRRSSRRCCLPQRRTTWRAKPLVTPRPTTQHMGRTPAAPQRLARRCGSNSPQTTACGACRGLRKAPWTPCSRRTGASIWMKMATPRRRSCSPSLRPAAISPLAGLATGSARTPQPATGCGENGRRCCGTSAGSRRAQRRGPSWTLSSRTIRRRRPHGAGAAPTTLGSPGTAASSGGMQCRPRWPVSASADPWRPLRWSRRVRARAGALRPYSSRASASPRARAPRKAGRGG
mmetsp:Transcript_6136/g.20962  ORF Transcript_6136/g.20962 Transcript_6136/m.20962 type:complete len:266 (-) Transcript_6136:1047-1844(-)